MRDIAWDAIARDYECEQATGKSVVAFALANLGRDSEFNAPTWSRKGTFSVLRFQRRCCAFDANRIGSANRGASLFALASSSFRAQRERGTRLKRISARCRVGTFKSREPVCRCNVSGGRSHGWSLREMEELLPPPSPVHGARIDNRGIVLHRRSYYAPRAHADRTMHKASARSVVVRSVATLSARSSIAERTDETNHPSAADFCLRSPAFSVAARQGPLQ